ncbi:hypothetical protein NMG60_11003237 [Bertholletia excelsa]
MAMAGVAPQILMKSAYRSVMFYTGQKGLEMQKCEAVQQNFTERLEQGHTTYQEMAKRCQMLEREIDSLSNDEQELQEKFSEKSGRIIISRYQAKDLDEMYEQLRGEHFNSRVESDLFSDPSKMLDNRDLIRKDYSIFNLKTPASGEDLWPPGRKPGSSYGPFDISAGVPAKQSVVPIDAGKIRSSIHLVFEAGASNPSMTLRNLILSPIKRPHLSHTHPWMFI